LEQTNKANGNLQGQFFLAQSEHQNNRQEFNDYGTLQMNTAKRRFLFNTLKMFDISQMILSFGLTTILVVYSDQGASLEQFLSIRIKLSNCVIFGFILLISHMIFSFCGLYESRRLSTKRAEILQVFKATTLSSVCLALMARLFRITMLTPRFLVSFWVISSLLLVTSRLILRPCWPPFAVAVEISATFWLWVPIHERLNLPAEFRINRN